MVIKWIVTLIFVVLFAVYSYNPISGHNKLAYEMYKTETISQVELNDKVKSKEKYTKSLVINLSKKELAYHFAMATTLMKKCGYMGLIEKIKMAEICENYSRALYKVEGTVIANDDKEKISHKLIYYVYAFVYRNVITRKSGVPHLYVVCVFEDNNATLLNLGFKENCKTNNNWIYWVKKDCPDMLYLECELKKAFNIISFGKSRERKINI